MKYYSVVKYLIIITRHSNLELLKLNNAATPLKDIKTTRKERGVANKHINKSTRSTMAFLIRENSIISFHPTGGGARGPSLSYIKNPKKRREDLGGGV